MPWTEAKGKELVECKTCKAQVQRRCFRNHLISHAEPRFPCEICGIYKGKRISALKYHQRTVHQTGGESVNDCLFCKTKLATFSALEKHLRSHTKEFIYSRDSEKVLKQCEICKRSVQSGSWAVHIRSHSKGKFPCDICKTYRANTATRLRRHQHVIHNIGGQSKFDCIFCKKRTGAGRHLELHLQSHIRERPFLCKICPGEFCSSQAFEYHMRNHKDPNRKPQFECHLCPKKFRARNGLKLHLVTHAERKVYKCNVCPKEFITLGGLRIHLKIHSLEEPYLCGFCDQTFKYKTSLERHILDHTGERFFPCKFCNKKFKWQTDLTNHVKWTHSDNKYLFKCQTCDKKFREKYALNLHVLQIHTKERPFICACGKGFASKGYLKLHQKTHFGKKRYSCKECQKKFLKSSRLEIHMRTHSGEKPDS